MGKEPEKSIEIVFVNCGNLSRAGVFELPQTSEVLVLSVMKDWLICRVSRGDGVNGVTASLRLSILRIIAKSSSAPKTGVYS